MQGDRNVFIVDANHRVLIDYPFIGVAQENRSRQPVFYYSCFPTDEFALSSFIHDADALRIEPNSKPGEAPLRHSCIA